MVPSRANMLPHLLYNFIDTSKQHVSTIPRIVHAFQHQGKLQDLFELIEPLLRPTLRELMIAGDYGLMYPKILSSEGGYDRTDKWEIVEYCLLSENKTGPLQMLFECFREYFRPRIVEKIMGLCVDYENEAVLEFMMRHCKFEIDRDLVYIIYVRRNMDLKRVLLEAGFRPDRNTLLHMIQRGMCPLRYLTKKDLDKPLIELLFMYAVTKNLNEFIASNKIVDPELIATIKKSRAQYCSPSKRLRPPILDPVMDTLNFLIRHFGSVGLESRCRH